MNDVKTECKQTSQELSPPESIYYLDLIEVSLIGNVASSGYQLKSKYDTSWMGGVACERGDADLMFADDDTSRNGILRNKAAKMICAKCTMKEPCLEYALLNNIKDGVWGDTTSGERKKLQKFLRQLASQ